MEEIDVMLKNYLSEYFSNVPLESPLFYNAPVGLRFELGNPDIEVEDPTYFKDILFRSSMLFKEVFDSEQQIIVIVKSFRCVKPYISIDQGEEVFPKYIKDKELIKQINSMEAERHYAENGDLSGITYNHILICNTNSIDYIGILKAKAHQDFSIEPYIDDSVFFIDPHKHIIYYMYDDRWLDLISERKETLLPIYKKYNSWILAYDKERIDNVFMN